MSDIQYTSLDRIFAKLYRDLPLDGISETDVVEWAGEALEAIGAVTMYEEAVAFIEVRNHQCAIPSGLHNIIQVAKNMRHHIGDDEFCPKNVINELKPPTPGPDIPVALNCNGEPANAYDLAYYRPYFDLQFEYHGWRNHSYYSNYAPIRLSTNTFFDNLVCRDRNGDSEYRGNNPYSADEYTVIQGKFLRFTFREGLIALAYNRQMVDPETGYPMVPDDFSTTTAITKYITLRLMEREFYANREGSASRVQKAEQDWHWYCKQAGNKHFIPNGIDQMQNLTDQMSYLFPVRNRYYGFFGNLNQPENRKYNDPAMRNNSFHFYNQ